MNSTSLNNQSNGVITNGWKFKTKKVAFPMFSSHFFPHVPRRPLPPGQVLRERGGLRPGGGRRAGDLGPLGDDGLPEPPAEDPGGHGPGGRLVLHGGHGQEGGRRIRQDHRYAIFFLLDM